MSYSIPENHVQQFKANLRLLSQQKSSRLRRTVRDDGDIVGDRVHFDRLAASEAQRITDRHSDTPLNNSDHSRRSAFMYDYDWAELVDKPDRLKTLYSPDNYYAMNGRAALGRAQDDEIITALGGDAYGGKDGSTVTAFKAAQVVAVDDHTYDSASGNAGMSITKLMVARDIIYGADVDEDQKLYCALTQKALSSLLSGDSYRAANIDFAAVKALVNGEINTLLGIEFVRIERLIADANTHRECFVYTETGIGAGTPADITVDIGPRRDKRNATQIYAMMSCGAVRVEDAHVVKVLCASN
jgi:hypothetical protein